MMDDRAQAAANAARIREWRHIEAQRLLPPRKRATILQRLRACFP